MVFVLSVSMSVSMVVVIVALGFLVLSFQLKQKRSAGLKVI